ncbi:MAG: GNAT family N-acetyltransferase [Nanoarchaeota archaeon]|nr:GNAT family N-acetyltransferase [Nanoarchaeota archaeon]
MRVRKANEDDAPVLEKIFSSLYKPEKKWSEGRIREKMKTGRREYYLLVEEIGQGAIELEWGVNECELVAIAAHPRGKGIGSRLITFAEDLALDKSCHKIWCYTLDTNHSEGFYSRRKWEQEDYLPNFLGEQGCFKFFKELR